VIGEEFITALHPNSLREIARKQETSPHVLEMLLQSKMATKKVRVAVASNLNTPVHILEKLAGEEDEEVRRATFLNPSTPTAIFQLFHEYQSAITLVTPKGSIVNLQASAETLCKIVKSQSQWTHICKQVAIHPNTPTSLLIDFAHHKYWRIRASVAGNPNLPIHLLEQLARDKRLGVRQAVVFNPNTPTTLLTRLLKDKSWDLRRNITQHPNVTPAILVSLAKDNYASVRVAVVANPKTPIQVLEQLAADSDTYVRKCVAQNSRISATVLMQLAEDSSSVVRQAVASNANTPPLVLTKLAEDEDTAVRMAIAQNSNTPNDVLTYLKGDKYDWIKQAAWKTRKNRNSSKSISKKTSNNKQLSNQLDVTSNLETSIETLLKLIETKDSHIREVVFANLYRKIALTADICDIADLLAEVCSKSDNVDLKIALARHPHTSPSTLHKFASSPSFRLRRLVAQNPNLSANLLEKLLEDRNPEVRRAALQGLLNQVKPHSKRELSSTLNEFLQQWQATQNPNTPNNILIHLANSKWVIIREAVALHPQAAMIILNPINLDLENTSIQHKKTNVPITLLEKLANDKNLVVKIAVAKNTHVPQNILEHLTRNHHCESLIYLAAVKTLLHHYPQRVGFFLERYISNNSFASLSRFFILGHPHTNSDLLTKHFRSSSWLERYAIASNPNTPQHIREHLAQDANRIVRAAAKANLNL
jgi:Leucine rich repeat variant